MNVFFLCGSKFGNNLLEDGVVIFCIKVSNLFNKDEGKLYGKVLDKELIIVIVDIGVVFI